MAHTVHASLVDMESAIDGIEAAIAGLDLASFRSSWVIRHAVQRGLEIISEASRRLPDELLAEHPAIPWRQVRDIGNVLRHAYHGVDDAVIWSIARDDLEFLKQAVGALRAGLAK